MPLGDKQTNNAVAAWQNPGQRSVRAHACLREALYNTTVLNGPELQTKEEPLKQPLNQELDVSNSVVDASYRYYSCAYLLFPQTSVDVVNNKGSFTQSILLSSLKHNVASPLSQFTKLAQCQPLHCFTALHETLSPKCGFKLSR